MRKELVTGASRMVLSHSEISMIFTLSVSRANVCLLSVTAATLVVGSRRALRSMMNKEYCSVVITAEKEEYW